MSINQIACLATEVLTWRGNHTSTALRYSRVLVELQMALGQKGLPHNDDDVRRHPVAVVWRGRLLGYETQYSEGDLFGEDHHRLRLMIDEATRCLKAILSNDRRLSHTS